MGFPIARFHYQRMSTLHAGKVATVVAEFFASSPLNPQAFGLAHSPLPSGMRTCLTGSTSQRKPVEEEEHITYLEAPKEIATSSATTMFWKTAVQLASGAGAWRLLIGVDRSPWDGKPDETGCSGFLWGTSDPL